jgi:lipopolysaccharide export system permease protein
MSILSATLLVFGRLTSDNEITAMRSNGINLYSLSIPLIVSGIIISLLSVILNNKILPEAHLASRKLIKEIGTKSPCLYLESGTFIKNFKQYIIFIQQIDKNRLKGVRIYQIQDDKPTRTIIANEAIFIPLENQNAIKLKLIDGTSDEPTPKNPLHFYKLNFKTYYITLTLDENIALDTGHIEKKPKEMNFHEIKQEIKRLGVHHIDAPSLISEYHRKLSISFSNIVFIIIGIALGIFSKGGEKTAQFAIALGVIVIYYLLMAGAMAISLKVGKLIPLWIYLPNAIFVVLGIVLLRKKISCV